MRNQVKKPEVANQKQAKSTEDEDDTIKAVIDMNQHVSLAFS